MTMITSAAARRDDKAVRERGSRFSIPAALLCALAIVAALVTAQPTWAAVTTLSGDRLTIFVGDTGSLNARLVGSQVNTFYPPDAQEGDAGLTIGFPTTAANPAGLDGRAYRYGQLESVAQTPVSGLGTPASPLTQVTTLRTPNASATNGLQLIQTVSYVQGDTSFLVRYDVSVLGGVPLNFRLSESADLFVDDTDHGVGQLRAGPPRAVLGVNPEPNGGTGGIAEVTPWSRYFEGAYTSANEIPQSPDGPGYANTVAPGLLDNGVGVQFDTFAAGAGLAPGATATFQLRWIFTPGDRDADGVINGGDNCRDVFNPDQADRNGNGVGDACDEPDADNDGVFDSDDNCRTASNPGQEDADEDGIGDACDSNDLKDLKDRDGDGVADSSDNCAEVRNADQRDTDGDRLGDACDPEPRGPDADRDTILDGADNCREASNSDNGTRTRMASGTSATRATARSRPSSPKPRRHAP